MGTFLNRSYDRFLTLCCRSSVKTTYPRLGDDVGFITPEEGLNVAIAVMTTQRDHGNRAKSVSSLLLSRIAY